VGASGSCTRSAKLFVPEGAPDHASAGETFCPEQPKPLNTCSIAMGPLGLMSGLLSLNAARGALFLRAFFAMIFSRKGHADSSPYNAALCIRPHAHTRAHRSGHRAGIPDHRDRLRLRAPQRARPQDVQPRVAARARAA